MKDKILKTARELFVKRGVRDVNIDEICHEIGISKKTFYQYYESKEDLVGYLVDTNLQAIDEGFHAAVKGKTAIEVLSFVFDTRKKTSAMVDKKIADDIRKYYHETFVSHTKKVGKYVKDALLEYMEKGVEEGVFRSDLDRNAFVLLMAMLHKTMVNYIEGEYIIEGRRISAHALDEAFKDIVTSTLLTEKGRELYKVNK